MNTLAPAVSILVETLKPVKFNGTSGFDTRSSLAQYIAESMSDGGYLSSRHFGTKGDRPRPLSEGAFAQFFWMCTATISESICLYDGDHPNTVSLGLNEHYAIAWTAAKQFSDAGYLNRYLMVPPEAAVVDDVSVR